MLADLNLLALVSLAAVIMIGMPHGALDGAVAIAVGYGKRWQDITKFAAAYSAIALLVVIVWMAAPITSLTVFMVISMIHFGLGDHNAHERLARITQIICHGGIVVIAIPHAHHDAVMPILMTLTGTTASDDLTLFWQLLTALGIVYIAASLLYGVLALKNPSIRVRLTEFLALNAIIALFPPLTGFALYFCAVHTPRHVKTIVTTIKAYDSQSKILPLTALFTAMTWMMAAIIIVFSPDSVHLNDVILRLIFIGLAALTVPHMMLVDGIFRPKFLTPKFDHS